MSIGYACITLGKMDVGLKSCILKNASKEKLLEVIEHNLGVLEDQISYNISNNIKLFRISSDIIPFGSHPINQIPWWKIYEDKLKSIGEKIIANKLRVSMHPGQYTVLNSPKDDVVKRAVDDLIYQTCFLDSLGVPTSCKIILHVGGIYGDKTKALSRFESNYSKLPDFVKKRLVIENDEKCYNIKDVLYLSEKLDIPVIFDNLHHLINGPTEEFDDIFWIKQANLTWKKEDGKQKIHYSQQCPRGKTGAHSQSINIIDFMNYYEEVNGAELDIMLEVKDKDLSAIKCIHCTTPNLNITSLEKQWAKYKYSILGKDAAFYNSIRQLLKEKKNPKTLEFYLNIEEALAQAENKGAENNAALHVWGYFKKKATDNERKKFYIMLEKYLADEVSLRQLKNYLKKLAKKYNESYLLQSYYLSLTFPMSI